MKKKVNSQIDFADSYYQSFKMDNDLNLIVNLTSWDNKTITIVFKNTLQFLYKRESVAEQLYEILGDSSFLNEALNNAYGEKIPSNHLFKLYELEDIDDCSFIQVVAESVTVTKQ